MAQIKVSIKTRPNDQDAILLWPVPAIDGEWHCQQLSTEGLQESQILQAKNSSIGAQCAKSKTSGALLSVSYDFVPVSGADSGVLPADYWQVQDNKHTQASPELIEQVQSWVDPKSSQVQQLHDLIHNTADMFAYGHVEQRFTEGKAQVPSLCGITNGSCVDINTFLIASARNLGIKVQYLAGYWFHPERSHTHDMHCWLAFEVDMQMLFWDVAHHLKWGVADLHSSLNPAGGRRWLMSYGRGLEFDTPNGKVSISHFAEPIWVLSDGSQWQPELHIDLTE